MYSYLNGLTVVELSAFVAAPSCSLYLSQMGAEVIRIDTIGGGPDFRRWPLAANGSSFYWEGLNKGKKSVALNLAVPEGRELALEIATVAGENKGLVVTNFPTRGTFSYAAFKKRRSDVICLRVMGWPDGAPGVDYTVNAATGFPFLTGPEDNVNPVNHVLPAWDLLAGGYGAFALLAAERNRRMTGKGCEVAVALSDLAAATLSNLGNVAEVISSNKDRPRSGNDLYGAFGRDFETRDGHRIMVVALTAKQWTGLIYVLKIEREIMQLETKLGISLARDEGLRFVHRDALNPIFAQAIKLRHLSDLSAAFEAEAVTWARYQTVHEAVTQDERLFCRNAIFESIEQPSGMDYPAAGAPAVISEVPRNAVRPAPKLGQDTDEVLSSVLKLSASQISALYDKGVVSFADKTVREAG